MDSFMSIPQFSTMNAPQIPQSNNFNGQLVTAALPKILAFSQTPQGNVCLYEVTELVILLSVPTGMELTIQDVRKSDKPYKTPHGEKTGYVFYKNQTKHMETLDSLFNGADWRKELSAPLPAPIVPKDPFLLCDRNILHNGIQMRFLLFEYSDKSLSFFTPVDITGGDEKLGKPWRSLTCPGVPGGKANGYLAYKNNTVMMNFIKSLVPDLQFETMYTKSPPLTATVIKKQIDPQLLETKQFMHNDVVFVVDFYEYSSVSIALFPSPMFPINGLQVSSNLNHPVRGPSNGYIVAKANLPMINVLKTFFKFDNLESLYTMTDEPERSLPAPAATQQNQPSSLSNLGIKSFDDLPIETLIRVLSNKLKETNEIVVRELFGDKILIYGNSNEVEEKVENYSGGTLSFNCTVGDKTLITIDL